MAVPQLSHTHLQTQCICTLGIEGKAALISAEHLFFCPSGTHWDWCEIKDHHPPNNRWKWQFIWIFCQLFSRWLPERVYLIYRCFIKTKLSMSLKYLPLFYKSQIILQPRNFISLISWMTNLTCFLSVRVSLYNAEPIVFGSSLICPCDKPCGDVIIPIKIHSVGNQPSSCLLPQSPSYTNTVWNPWTIFNMESKASLKHFTLGSLTLCNLNNRFPASMREHFAVRQLWALTAVFISVKCYQNFPATKEHIR